ncbi:MAG TPA: hypothetical protein P5274_01290 [Candidatus Paceibacterota bacterium]|nr:hypothetical protein [Candidatus Paceibacterota bacterium]
MLLLFLPFVTSASVTQQINYQGKLTNSSGTAVADGTYAMEFKLYDALTGGSVLWTETRTGADEVTVTDGLFSVMLGSVASLSSVDFNQALYLSINVESDGEMSPRKTLGTVPNSLNSLKFDGLASTSVAVLNRENVFTATTTLGSANEYIRTYLKPYGVDPSLGSVVWLQGRALNNYGGVSVIGMDTGVIIRDTNDTTYLDPIINFVDSGDASKMTIVADIDNDYLTFNDATKYTFDNDVSFGGRDDMLKKVSDKLVLPYKVRNIYVSDNYMYVATYARNSVDSFRIVDISDPEQPRVVGGAGLTGLPLLDAKRVWALGNYAYILYNSDGITNPFRIIDISDKSNPVVISGESLNFMVGDASPGQPFYIAGHYAYIMGDTKLYIIDISDPYNPRLESQLSGVSDTSWDIKVVSDYAYVCHREVVGSDIAPLSIINVRDKKNPVLIDKLSIPGLTYGCWSLDVAGPYVYLGMGNIGTGVLNNFLRIVDVSDPANPTILGGEDIGSGTIPLSVDDGAFNYVRIEGRRLYATTWYSNFVVMDVASSTNPTILSKTYLPDDGLNISGPLTFDFVGQYVAIGFAPTTEPYDIDSTNYFRMFKLPGIDSWGIHADALSTGALQVLNNAVFNQRVSIWDGLEIGTGGIYTQGTFSSMATTSANYFGGSVGIGTTTPIYKLSVNASNTTDHLFQVATTTNQNIFTINNDGIARFGNDITVSGTGTSTFAGNLNVTGNIAKDGTNYTNPSYVFDCYLDGACENYQFTPFSDAVAYMKENKHLINLPDINGVYFLEDRQRLQTEKLEEIMIYLSELRTEIDSFSGLFAGFSIGEDGTLVIKNIQAEKLCLGETCLTEIELKALLNNSNISPVIVTPIESAPSDLVEEATTTDPVVPDEPEPEPFIEPEIISEPVAPDPVLEPVAPDPDPGSEPEPDLVVDSPPSGAE